MVLDDDIELFDYICTLRYILEISFKIFNFKYAFKIGFNLTKNLKYAHFFIPNLDAPIRKKNEI